jgi:PAS domain S-box-containing protein
MLPIGRRTLSTRTNIAVLVTLLLVPVAISAVAANYHFLRTFNERVQEDALSVARRISADVDREVVGLQNTLRVLATSPTLATGDFAAFHRQAVGIAKVLGVAVIVKDETGRQLVNTRRAWGEPLPVSLPEADRGLADGVADVSGVFVGATAGGPVVRVALPVRVDGAGRLLLIVAFDPARFVPLITGFERIQQWTVALVDRSDHVIARSRQHETYVGAEATADLKARTGTGQDGVWIGTTLEGTQVLSAFVRSTLTGWRVAVGVPTDLVQQPLRESMIRLALIAGVGLSGSLAVATVLGARLSRALAETAAAAAALARAEQVSFVHHTSLRELADIDVALAKTARELDRRAAARDRVERDLVMANARLERVLNTSPVGIVELDAGGAIRFANEAAVRLLGLGGDIGGRRYDAPEWGITNTAGEPIPSDDLPAARALRGERVTDYEHAIDLGTGERLVLSINAAPIAEGGTVTGAIATVVDVSTRYQAERRRQLLINELNHRVKNTLASVQAIADQTLATARSPRDALDALGERLRAMAGAHDLLTRENWESAELGSIVAAALTAFRTERADRIRVRPGPALRLVPRAALPIVLALHELATNAVKYGALSSAGGAVDVAWTVDPAGDTVELVWTETGGPKVEPPARKGFGSRLLERGLAMELDARVDIRFEPTGVVARFSIPLAPSTVPA